MLECLLLLTFAGLVLASQRKIGLANPFQIYFFVWFFVFFGYYILQESFVGVSSEFLMLMLVVNAAAILFLVVIYQEAPKCINSETLIASTIQLRDRPILMAQIIVLIALYFVYDKAVSLAGGDDVFSILGFIKLRRSLTGEGGGFGYLAYFFVLAFVLSSLRLQSYLDKASGLLGLIASTAASLLYVYLSTGRTFVLFFASIMFFPLIMRGFIKVRGLLVSALLVACLFVFVAAMTTKGISMGAGFSQNLGSFLDSLRAYTIAPILALSGLMGDEVAFDFGLNTFRSVIAVFYALGMSGDPPVSLIKDYSFVPDPTNVYTVYEVYFRDFSYPGLLAPLIFLMIHWALYVRAHRIGGIWIFYYAASAYPLLMQFFQDQYFSLLSQWVQIGFWYWIFVRSEDRRVENNYA
jgi:oligosaccharide repeat unit polymerase